jgi:hypothetical protein
LIIETRKLVDGSLSNLENKNEASRSGKERYPSRVLFIGLSKRLKNYYVPRA